MLAWSYQRGDIILISLIVLILLLLSLWEGFRDIHKGDFTDQEKKVLVRQLIASTSFFLIIFAWFVNFVVINSIVFVFILIGLPLFYLGVSAISSGISFIAFRGQKGPIRGTAAIGMGVLEITLGCGMMLYYLIALQ